MARVTAIDGARDTIGSAWHVVVFTGAGMSKESGIPTFRDAQEGLWAKYDPAELATLEGFRRNPELVWTWYQYRRTLVEGVHPHVGHRAVTALDKVLPKVVVVTQNIDNLHREAGSANVIELHGNIRRVKCLEEGIPLTCEDIEGQEGIPPRCPSCGAYVRPDVVWFGEPLPEKELSRALAECSTCDVMLIVGTSGVVQPAASLPMCTVAGWRYMSVHVISSGYRFV
jgi:NAD-dependent deacetylase